MKRLLFITILFFSLPSFAYGATEFVSIVDPGNGADTDYTSLSLWEAGAQTDLTAAATQVFAGTRDNAVADNATVYLCDSANSYRGESATVVHATATQILVESIASAVTEVATDYWYSTNTCSGGTKYFTLSDGGDSAIAIAKCRTSSGAADTTAVTIADWTTSATNYIKIWTDPNEPYRHEGKWDDGKYRLVGSGANGALTVSNQANVKIYGLQVEFAANTGFSAIIYTGYTGDENSEVAYNLVRSTVSVATSFGIRVSVGTAYNKKIHNNIVYNFTAGINGGSSTDGTVYVYNNTLYGCTTSGIDPGYLDVVAKNNLVQNSTNSFNGSFYSASTYNLTDESASAGAFGVSADSGNTDGIGADTYKLRDTGQNFLTTVKVGMIVVNTTAAPDTYSYVTAVNSDTELTLNDDILNDSENYTIYTNMYGTVAFEDSANSDFHLDSSDTVAKNKGANLYADGSLAITTDIDGSSRPNSATMFDIGADEASTQIYYSVGQNATSTSHETGAGQVDVDATARTATFTVAQTATNMGVGDVIDYDSDNKICYITEKVSTSIWKCQTATGGAPTDSGGNVTVNSIHHTFQYLVNAEDDSDDAGYLNNSNLVTGNYVLNIPCYYDTGADQTVVSINGYTTGHHNYIKIYTPNNISTEVNQSQRHGGVYDTSKYRMEVAFGANGYVLQISEEYVRVDGLQLKISNSDSYANNGISIQANNASSAIKISNNIITKGTINGSSSLVGIHYISSGTYNLYAWNNIIYDLDTLTSFAVYQYSSATYTKNVYLYNNTIVNCPRGIAGNAAVTGFVTYYAINNIVKGSGDINAYSGTFDASSDYNATDGTDATDGGTHSLRSQTFSFVDETGDDYHIASTDTAVTGNGISLATDTYLPFSDDIDSEERTGNWTIGADEPYGAKINSPNLPGGSKMTINMSLADKMTTGLVGHWTFDGPDTTTTTATDMSVNSNDGTISGATPAIGKLGQALDFNGTTSSINAASDATLDDIETQGGGGMTVSAWIKPRTAGEGNAGIVITKGLAAGGGELVFGLASSNELLFRKDYQPTDLLATTQNSTISLDAWQHVMVTWDGSATAANVRFYINGSEKTKNIQQNGDSSKASDAAQSMYIGNNSVSSTTFDGHIDDVRVYNRALTTAEVGDLYRLGQARIRQ